MCQYPYGKNTGAGRGSNPGGNQRDPRVATPPRVAIVVQPRCEVQPLGSTPRCEVQTGGKRLGCNARTPPHAYALFLRSYNRGTTTGLKPELQLHSPPNRRYCPRLHARGSGYFLRAVSPALEASVEHWRRTYVIERPELLLGLLFVRGRPPPIAEAHRAIPLGYDPPANGQSVLAPSFRGRERAEFQPGLQPERSQTRGPPKQDY